ncbi:class I SAM-dependent methyltransferase [Candidatus Parcubacteria bacterium]|nr:class I SAM-dependent methyltransferase [Candidatus Parcubacteria bacterium]
MDKKNLVDTLKPHSTIDREGILVAKEIADKTVWDKLALENPTHAVISAGTEAEAAKKSAIQIADIKEHVQAGDILLDLGTGYGRVAKYLLPEMPLTGYIGVDSAYAMLALFRERYSASPAEQKTPLLLINADIHTLPLQDVSVDTVIVSAVFLHNHKNVVEQAMAELKRVVKPGGTILIYSSFPRAATCMGMQGLAYQAFLNLVGRPFKNGPVRYYWRSEIMHLFDGFTEVTLKPVGYAVVPKSLIFLPKTLDKIWRVGFANPLNRALEYITPTFLKYYCAVHFDVVAKR